MLKMSMFVNADRPHQEKPFLRTKAAECKGLVPVFAALALEFNDGSETDSHLIQMYEAMSQFLLLLEASPMFPSPDQAIAARTSMSDFLRIYKQLQAARASELLWHCTIKFHMCQHLADSFKWSNPRYSWCFKHEDKVGKISRLGHSACFGVSVMALSDKIAEKYRYMQLKRFWLSE